MKVIKNAQLQSNRIQYVHILWVRIYKNEQHRLLTGFKISNQYKSDADTLEKSFFLYELDEEAFHAVCAEVIRQ